MTNCDTGIQRLEPNSSYDGAGQNETDSLPIEIRGNCRRLLYFSDGTMEELVDSDNDETDKNLNIEIDEKTLPFLPRIKYQATKFGERILAGIDFIGEGLASFLGITTPQYARQIQYFNRNMSSDTDETEYESNAWGSNNNSSSNNEFVVTEEPTAAYGSVQNNVRYKVHYNT